jgi:hypothetical protein
MSYPVLSSIFPETAYCIRKEVIPHGHGSLEDRINMRTVGSIVQTIV